MSITFSGNASDAEDGDVTASLVWVSGLAASWVEFDVTAAIQGNGVHSFGLGGTAAKLVAYNAKEAAESQPILVIEMATGP